MHWSARYLNKPWVVGSRGPDAYDCWGLAIDVYKRFLGIDIDIFDAPEAKSLRGLHKLIEEQQESGDWIPLETPEDMCLVLMGRNKAYHHIGIYLEEDGGKILHTFHGSCATVSPLHKMRLRTPLIAYYRHG